MDDSLIDKLKLGDKQAFESILTNTSTSCSYLAEIMFRMHSL